MEAFKRDREFRHRQIQIQQQNDANSIMLQTVASTPVLLAEQLHQHPQQQQQSIHHHQSTNTLAQLAEAVAAVTAGTVNVLASCNTAAPLVNGGTTTTTISPPTTVVEQQQQQQTTGPVLVTKLEQQPVFPSISTVVPPSTIMTAATVPNTTVISAQPTPIVISTIVEDDMSQLPQVAQQQQINEVISD